MVLSQWNFVPLCVDSMGAWAKNTQDTLSKCADHVPKNRRAHTLGVWRQILSVALQKEKAQKNEKVVEMTKLLREKGDEIVVLKAENMNSLNRVKDTDILAKVKPTKTGNSLTSSGVRGRDVSQNDMILKAHKPGSIRSNASDTKTLPQQSLRKKMGFEAGKDLTRGKHEENLVQEVSKLKKRRRLLNQSTIEDIQRV